MTTSMVPKRILMMNSSILQLKILNLTKKRQNSHKSQHLVIKKGENSRTLKKKRNSQSYQKIILQTQNSYRKWLWLNFSLSKKILMRNFAYVGIIKTQQTWFNVIAAISGFTANVSALNPRRQKILMSIYVSAAVAVTIPHIWKIAIIMVLYGIFWKK